ncbi:MAG: hypothetical protein IPL26_20635 [Leptospiraceae bacterium]|nr:hypothetical protein [Leptospiraceae bacterium]
MYLFIISLLFILFSKTFSQSQEEILRDLREDNVIYDHSSQKYKNIYLEKLKIIHLKVNTALETKEDVVAVVEANKMESYGITSDTIKVKGIAELGEEQTLYLKIRRLRAEAYYNLREFKNALPDSKFIVENHPRTVVFDYTRYALSLYYSGNEKDAKRILLQAKAKFKNENDQNIISKTTRLLFPDY